MVLADTLITNVQLMTLNSKLSNEEYGAISDAAIAIKDGDIIWVGNGKDIGTVSAQQTYDGQGKWLSPGLIDCHTHLVFAGNRANEFAMRLQGKSYLEIAQQGGGIIATVKATREATEQALYELAAPRVAQLICEGVTTLEIKSGYGLDLDSELKMLRVARQLAANYPIDISTTLLAAHAVPPEYRSDPDGYVDLICQQIIPAAVAEGLVDAVDGFCEGIGFSVAQMTRIFDVAKQYNLPVKLHAEQLSDLSGAALVAQYDGLSADHVEFVSASSVQQMAQANTVAVLLPGAFYTLSETQLPPIQLFRDHKVPMALASDFNPGSSPLCSLKLMLHMGCTLFKLTPEEAIRGVTVNAAKALGLTDQGMIAEGAKANLCLWDIQHPAELAYTFGVNPLVCRWHNGLQQ